MRAYTTGGTSTRISDCIVCGHKADGRRHACPEIWTGSRASETCDIHDTIRRLLSNGERRCDACKSAYDKARYEARKRGA